MSDKEILEGNRIIAEFLNYQKRENVFESRPIEFMIGNYWTVPESMKYHSSWDWLMPVVEKIEGLGFGVNINGNECYITPPDSKGKLVCHTCRFKDKLTTVYQAIISAIQWYNQNTTSPSPGRN